MAGGFLIGVELAVQANRQQLAAATNQIRAALSGVSVPVGVKLDPAQVGAAQAALTKLQSQAAATASALSTVGTTSARSAAGIGAAALGIGGLATAIRDAGREALAFNRTQVQLTQVSEDGAGAVRGVVEEVGRLSAQYGVSSGELLKTARDLKSAGFSISETSAALSALSKASLSPSFGGPLETADGFIAAVRQFGLGARDYEKTLGGINALSNAYAAESRDLTAGISRAGASFKAAGGSLQEFTALLTVARSASREGAPEISEAIKTLGVRLQRPDTIAALKGAGIELRRNAAEAAASGDPGSEGQFVGPFEAVRRLNRGLSGIPTSDPRAAAVLEKAAGADQLSRVITLVREATEAEKALLVARAGEASLNVSAAQGQDAYATRLARVREQLLSLTREAGDSRGVRVLFDAFEGGAKAATELARALGPLLPLLAGVAAYRVGAAGLGAAGLTGGALTRGRLAAGGALVAASAAPALLEGAFGQNRATASVGGALQFGAAGALAGSVFGPVGAAVGGAVGALGGFTVSLREASAAIRQAAIDKDLGEVRSRLIDAKAGDNPAALAALNTAVGRARVGIEGNAAATATFLGRFDPADYQKQLADGTRKEVGPLLVPITEALAKQAELTGRRNPSADADGLTKRFRESNAELLRALGGVKGVSPEDAAKEFAAVIRSAQASATADSRALRVQTGAGRAGADFARLVTSVERAAESVGPLNQRGAALASLGEGGGFTAPTPVNTNDPAALARLLSPLGSGGASLLASAEAGRQLRDVLPGALSQAATGEALEGGAVGARVRALATASLGGRLTAEQGRGLDAVIDRLDKLDVGEFRKRVQADPNRLTSDALSEFLAPIEDTAGRLARLYDEAGGKLADALNRSAGRVADAGEAFDQAARLRLDSLRVGAAIEADRTGRRPTDLLSLRDLDTPFRQRQERLTGREGPAAFDVTEIAARLEALRAAIPVATAERDKAVGTPAALTAAENLSRLATEGANLQSALRALANASERAAGVQEKLSAATANRDARLGYAEKFLTADAGGRAKLARGQRLLTAVDDGRTSLRELSLRQRQAFFESARDLGQVVLPSGRTGAEVARRAVGAIPGVLDPSQEKDRGELQNKLAEVFKTAEAAQTALATFTRDTNAQFVANLRTAFDAFLAKLGAELASGRVSSARAEEATAGDKLREVREQAAQRTAVRGLGIAFGNRDDLDRVRGYRDQLAKFAAGQAEIDSLLSGRAKLGRNDFATGLSLDKAGTLNRDSGEALLRRLQSEFGLDSGTAVRVAGGANDRLALQARRGPIGNPADAINTAVRQALNAATTEDVGKLRAPLIPLASQLRGGLPGLNLDKLTPASVEAVDKALPTFGKAGAGLEGLDQRIREAADAHQRAAAAVGQLEAAAKSAAGSLPSAPVPGFASGGRVAGPPGRDVIAARLTRGEFVVNPESASANAGLLDRINNTREPLRLANGGPVDPLAAIREARREFYEGIAAREKAAAVREAARKRDEARAFRTGVGLAFSGSVARQSAAVGFGQALQRGAYGLPGEAGLLEANAGAVAARRAFDTKRADEAFGPYLRRPKFFATGGPVGTDTVPAWLTPGEYVFSRPAVQTIGAANLDRAHRMAAGGVVPGGNPGSGPAGNPQLAAAMAAHAEQLKRLIPALDNGFGGHVGRFVEGVGAFGRFAERFAKAVEGIPTEIATAVRGELAVNVNGAEGFAQLEKGLKDAITRQVTEKLEEELRQRFPDMLGPPGRR